MKFVEVRVKKNTHEPWGLARRATCWKRGIRKSGDRDAHPAKPFRNRYDTARKPGHPLVPRDTRPNPAEQNEPPVENV